jgi:hypothetical protein
VFIIFHHFQFSHHTPVPTVCFSHFPRFLVFLSIFQVLPCVCLIFHVIQWYSVYFISHRVSFSFYSFSSFISIFQVLQYEFVIFHVFQCF